MPPTMWNMSFGSTTTTSNVVRVATREKKNVLNWPIVPNTWPMTIGTNLLRDEVLAVEDVEFQCSSGKHSLLVEGFQQSQNSPSLGHIFRSLQPGLPPNFKIC